MKKRQPILDAYSMSFTMSLRTFLDVSLLLLGHQQSQEEEHNKENI